MTAWVVAHCHANAETKAEAHLRRQGFDVYLPKFKTTRNHARRIETVIRPLFPRYVFVGLNEAAVHWRPIRSTIGVCNLVSAGDHPLPVPDWVIDQLQHREDANGLFASESGEPYRKGESITVTGGPFLGCQGAFESISGDQRVAVLLDIMGRQVKTVVSRGSVRRVA